MREGRDERRGKRGIGRRRDREIDEKEGKNGKTAGGEGEGKIEEGEGEKERGKGKKESKEDVLSLNPSYPSLSLFYFSSFVGQLTQLECFVFNMLSASCQTFLIHFTSSVSVCLSDCPYVYKSLFIYLSIRFCASVHLRAVH